MYKSLAKYLSFSYLFLLCVLVSAQNLKLSNMDTLKMPLPLPYNGVVYSEVEIDNFIDKTIDDFKQPVIVFGGNWCPDCRIFSGVIELPSINKFFKENYRIMYVDVGRYEINMNLMSYFDIPEEEGVPRVLVFDKQRKILNNSSTKEWTTARDREYQEIFDYFQKLAE